MNRATVWLMAGELVVFLLWFLHGRRTAMEKAGAGVIVVSLVLVMVARVQLGRSFSVRARATRLVTTGVYARVRNPIYLASGALLVGIALLLGSWWPLGIVAVLAPVQWRRAGREARVLRERFGEEYEQYRRGTWF